MEPNYINPAQRVVLKPNHHQNTFTPSKMGQDGDAPISIIRVRDVPDEKGRSFIFNTEIARIFRAPEVADLPVAVISLAGVTKTGKSFFLTLLLKYAVAKYLEKSDLPWLDDEDQMGGFEFSPSSAIGTSGILMWPMLFECARKDGRKICILLIDTQGTYEGEGSSTIGATVFAMSVLMSSLQIYNVAEEITEDDLQSLELYIGLMAFVPEMYASKRPGQNLLFLVRDFKLEEIYSYGCGLDGGNRYMYDLILNSDIDEMHAEVRDRIIESFDNIQCCTLPYPGRKVVDSTHFAGKVKDIHSQFRDHGARIVEHVLNPKHLIPKKVNGKIMSCRDLFEHFNRLVYEFNKLELPTIVSPLRALAEEGHEAAVDAAVKLYVSNMEAGGCTRRFIGVTQLHKTNYESIDRAFKFFGTKLKIGQGKSITPMYEKKLHGILMKKFDEYQHLNRAILDSVSRELPIWSLGGLCTVQLLDEVKPNSATKWVKLTLMTRLFFWLLQFYRKGIFGEH